MKTTKKGTSSAKKTHATRKRPAVKSAAQPAKRATKSLAKRATKPVKRATKSNKRVVKSTKKAVQPVKRRTNKKTVLLKKRISRHKRHLVKLPTIAGFAILIISSSIALTQVLTAAALAPVSGSSPTILPDVISSVGDSISDRPNAAESWTTGSNSKVNSIASRLKAARGTAITVSPKAKAGMTSSSLNSQMKAAINTKADLITVLMGANDACADKNSQMTPTATFRKRYSDALTLAQNANRKVVAVSIPNIHAVWQNAKGSLKARATWTRYGICQNMLQDATSTTKADNDRRNAVKKRIMEYNEAIKSECAKRSGCSYDKGAVFATNLKITDLGPDYFHPSIAGQAKIAKAVWPAVQAIYPGVLKKSSSTPNNGSSNIPYLKSGQSYERGVNMYTMEYTKNQSGYANLGEPQSSYDYIAKRGITTIRLTVPWVRLQPVIAKNTKLPTAAELRNSLKQPIDKKYLAEVKREIAKIKKAGMRTVLDLHNGCTYPWGPGNAPKSYIACGKPDGITIENVKNIWKNLSNEFKNDTSIIAYDLMNEPRYSIGQEVWSKYSQAMTDAIRENKDGHTLWVESLLGPVRGRLAVSAPNGPWIKDPLNKVMYSEHFYFAPVENGSTITDADFNLRLNAIREFGDWCKKFKVRCSIGEIGFPRDVNQPGRVASKAQYDKYSEAAYKLADDYKLDVTYFAATRLQCSGYIAYCSNKRSDPNVGLNTSNWQATVVERHLAK